MLWHTNEKKKKRRKGSLIKSNKKILKLQTTNTHFCRCWCINTFTLSCFYTYYYYYYLFINYYFNFNACADQHTLLFSQINLTWLCLHQFAGFLRRHGLHPICIYITCGNRKTHHIIQEICYLSIEKNILLCMRLLNGQGSLPNTCSGL